MNLLSQVKKMGNTSYIADGPRACATHGVDSLLLSRWYRRISCTHTLFDRVKEQYTFQIRWSYWASSLEYFYIMNRDAQGSQVLTYS